MTTVVMAHSKQSVGVTHRCSGSTQLPLGLCTLVHESARRYRTAYLVLHRSPGLSVCESLLCLPALRRHQTLVDILSSRERGRDLEYWRSGELPLEFRDLDAVCRTGPAVSVHRSRFFIYRGQSPQAATVPGVHRGSVGHCCCLRTRSVMVRRFVRWGCLWRCAVIFATASGR